MNMMSNIAARRLVNFAKKHLHKPYHYGARPSEAPRVFDCSSFVQYLYRRIGVELPRTSIEQAACGARVKNAHRSKLKIGDLLFFTGSVGRYNEDFPDGVGHVAMYLGDNQIVHAKYDEQSGGKVRIEPAMDWLRRKDLITVQRILENA